MDEEKNKVKIDDDFLNSLIFENQSHIWKDIDKKVEEPERALTRRVLFEKVNNHSFQWMVDEMQESLLKTMNSTFDMIAMLEIYGRMSKDIGEEDMDFLIDSINPASPDVS